MIILIKSVLLSILIYSMASSNVPKSMIRWIEKLMANFLWNSRGEARAHWVSWCSICSPIEEGWLNIRTLDGANFGPNLLVQNTLLLTHPLQKRLAHLCGLLLLLIIGLLPCDYRLTLRDAVCDLPQHLQSIAQVVQIQDIPDFLIFTPTENDKFSTKGYL